MTGSSRTQQTLGDRVTLSGVGVHSGKPVTMTLCPADAGSGIVFLRTNLADGIDREIPAHIRAVGATELCTVLGAPCGASVATVEHLVAALAGLGIDNCLVEIDGAEVPVMDGSAASYIEAIDQVGIVAQRAPKRFLKVLKPVRVSNGAAWAEFLPYAGTRFDLTIDYDCPVIGRQEIGIDIDPRSFRRDIARARTFGYMRDVEKLWAMGFAVGSSLENTVVIGNEGVVNPEGLRYRDEFVRHKVLDAIGDLALAGAPLQGRYRSYKGGHKLNAMALSALLADAEAWTLAGTEREKRTEGRAEGLSTMLAAAYAPDVS